NAVLETRLASPTIAHKGSDFEQDDQMIPTNTVIRPLADAAVVRINGTDTALAVTADRNSHYLVLDPEPATAGHVPRAAHHREHGTPPVLNLEREVALHRVVLQAIEQGLLRSAHDCAEGGLAVALAESCLSATNGPLGAEVVLSGHGLREDSLLFGEPQSRIILSVKSADR